MASENLARLQATVNRFVGEANFSPLVIDGGMGPKTITAIGAALSFASGAQVADRVNTAQGIQGATDAQMYDHQLRSGDPAAFIMQNVAGINTALSGVGDALGLTGAASVALTKPQTIPSTIGDKSAFKVKPAANAGMIDGARLWLRQLSTAGQAGVGAGVLLLLVFGASALKKRSKTRGIEGYRGSW